MEAVTEQPIFFFSNSPVSTGYQPLAKQLEDSGYVIGDYHETNPASVHRADSDHGPPENEFGHTDFPWIQLLLSNINFSQKPVLKWNLNFHFGLKSRLLHNLRSTNNT